MAEEDQEDQDVPEDEEDEGGESHGGGGKKLILILSGVTVLLLLIGGGLFFTGILDPLLGIEETEEDGAAPAIGEYFYKLEEITLNLGGEQKKSRFFKVGITIVLGSALDIPFVEALAPRIIDNVTAYLRELKPAEITGSANFNQLRENIRLRVRTAVAPTQVSEILFNSALVQ